MSACGLIEKFVNLMCDLSRYSTVKIDSPEYESFQDLADPFLAAVTQQKGLGCVAKMLEYDIAIRTDEDGDDEYSPAYLIDEKDSPFCNKEVMSKTKFILYDVILYFKRVPTFSDLPSTSNWQMHDYPRRLFNYHSEEVTHSNLVIINTEDKTVRLVEPNGRAIGWYDSVSAAAKVYFQNHFPGYKYVEGADACPYFGPQGGTKDEFCRSWTILIAFLTLSCPDASAASISRALFDLSSEKRIKVLQGWTCYMWQFAEENGLVEVWHNLQKIKDLHHTDYRDILNVFRVGHVELARRLLFLFDRFLRKTRGMRENSREYQNLYSQYSRIVRQLSQNQPTPTADIADFLQKT